MNPTLKVINSSSVFKDIIPAKMIASDAIKSLKKEGFGVLQVSNEHVISKTCQDKSLLYIAKIKLDNKMYPLPSFDQCEVILCIKNKRVVSLSSYIKLKSL